MKKSLAELADFVGGRLEGPANRTIRGVAGIKEASGEEITFLSNPRYEKYLEDTEAGAVLVREDWAGTTDRALIRVRDPYLAFARISALFEEKEPLVPGISDRAWVSDTARIGRDVSIHPFVYVGPDARIGDRVVLHPFVHIGAGVSLGDDCVLYPHVSVLSRCVIGNRVVVHSGTVIGSDGFGYARDGEQNVKVPQVGIVQIDDDVEIGANCAIDRAALGRTWIQQGVKIDNLVQVAHNVVVGAHTVLVAQVGISGSTEVGRNVQIGGQAGLVGHIRIGDRVGIAAQSGVTHSLEAGSVVSGTPAILHRQHLAVAALLPKLPRMVKRIRDLEKRLHALEQEKERG